MADSKVTVTAAPRKRVVLPVSIEPAPCEVGGQPDPPSLAAPLTSVRAADEEVFGEPDRSQPLVADDLLRLASTAPPVEADANVLEPLKEVVKRTDTRPKIRTGFRRRSSNLPDYSSFGHGSTAISSTGFGVDPFNPRVEPLLPASRRPVRPCLDYIDDRLSDDARWHVQMLERCQKLRESEK